MSIIEPLRIEISRVYKLVNLLLRDSCELAHFRYCIPLFQQFSSPSFFATWSISDHSFSMRLVVLSSLYEIRALISSLQSRRNINCSSMMLTSAISSRTAYISVGGILPSMNLMSA